MDLISHFSSEVARQLAKEQDALIRRFISNRIGDSWTDTEIIPRIRIEITEGHDEKMFLLDDKPLALIWPPVCSTQYDGHTNRMQWTVKYLEM